MCIETTTPWGLVIPILVTLKLKFEPEHKKGGLTMQKLPVMERFKWHVVHRAHTRKTAHVSWFWQRRLSLRDEKDAEKPVAWWTLRATGVVVDTLHLKALWPDEGKTHRYGSRPRGRMRVLMRTALSSSNPQRFLQLIFDYLAHFWWRLRSFQALGKQNRFTSMWGLS